MATGRRIARTIGAALVAAAAMLLPNDAAWPAPGCNLGDVFQAGENAAGALTSTACDATYATGPVGVGIAGAIAAGLAASGQANSLCKVVNTALSDISAITSWLQTAGINSDVLTEIAGIPGLDPVSVLQCGCDLEQGFDQLASDLGDCLCDLVSWIPGVNCNSCTPPPPIPANCSLPANCFIGSSDPACQANNVIPGCSTIEFGGVQNQICPGSEQDGPNGAFVTATTGNPDCPTTLYCFCPKPLVPTWPPVAPPQPSSGSSFPSGSTGVFTCACPDGSYQAGTAGGIPICLCDYTNQPPKVGDTPQERCPINLLGNCQPGQITTQSGKCVTPCSDPSMGMTPDGSCCDPNQVTACGQCCKAGTRPVNGTCVGPGPIQ